MYSDYQWFPQSNFASSNTSPTGFQPNPIQGRDVRQFPPINPLSTFAGALNYKDIINMNASLQTTNNAFKRSRDDNLSSNNNLSTPFINKGIHKKSKKEPGSKDPKMLLHELQPNLHMSEVISDSPGFKFAASFNGIVFEAVGNSKKLAKTALACKILTEHLNINLNNDNEGGINLVKYTPEQLKIKNPVSLLHEINIGRLLKFETKSLENSKIPIFDTSLDYNGKIYTALGLSKNKSKIAVARKVLQEFHSITIEATNEEVLDEIRIAELQNKTEKRVDVKPIIKPLGSGPIMKSPLALLHELVHKKYKCLIEPYETSAGFVAKFIYPDMEFQACGHNKKHARNETAKVVLLHHNINYDSYIEMYKASIIAESSLPEGSEPNLSSLTSNNAVTSNANKEVISTLPFVMLPLEAADTIAKMVLEKYKEITSKKICNLFANKYMIAGIVVRRGPWEDKNLEVLCVSNGSQCLSPQTIVKAFDIQNPSNTSESLNPKEGDYLRRFTHLDESLHDCHAEVLCRRALVRYIWLSLNEVLNAQDYESNPNCILEKISSSTHVHPRFRIKPQVSFYFYMSNFPCGSQFRLSWKRYYSHRGRKGPLPFNVTNQGLVKINEILRSPEEIRGDMVSPKSCPINKLFRRAMSRHQSLQNTAKSDVAPNVGDIKDNADVELLKEHEEGLSICENEVCDHSMVAEEAAIDLPVNFGIVSCADKIMMWEVVGWQGSELEKYVEPVYMAGIITSSQLPLISLYRTLYGRTAKFLQPSAWSKNYQSPNLQKTTFRAASLLGVGQRNQQFKRSHYYAFVWYIDDPFKDKKHDDDDKYEGTLEALDSRVGTVFDSVFVKKDLSGMGHGIMAHNTTTGGNDDCNASLSHSQVSSICSKRETPTRNPAATLNYFVLKQLNEAPSTPSQLCPKFINQLAHQVFDKFAAYSKPSTSYSLVKGLLQEYCEKEMIMGPWFKLRKD